VILAPIVERIRHGVVRILIELSESLIILFLVAPIAWVARRELGDFARDNNVMCG
jgi:hypothetical protein